MKLFVINQSMIYRKNSWKNTKVPNLKDLNIHFLLSVFFSILPLHEKRSILYPYNDKINQILKASTLIIIFSTKHEVLMKCTSVLEYMWEQRRKTTPQLDFNKAGDWNSCWQKSRTSKVGQLDDIYKNASAASSSIFCATPSQRVDW